MVWIPAKTTSKNSPTYSSGPRNATALRATITHTVDGVVAEESKRRFVDWRFEQPGNHGLGILRSEDERRAHGPDVPRDFYLSYEDTEQAVRLWHERPDLWREEILTSKARYAVAWSSAARKAHGGSTSRPRRPSTILLAP
jgi:hypothetical protein